MKPEKQPEPAERDRSEASLLKSLVERNQRETAKRLRRLGWRVLPPEKKSAQDAQDVVLLPRMSG